MPTPLAWVAAPRFAAADCRGSRLPRAGSAPPLISGDLERETAVDRFTMNTTARNTGVWGKFMSHPLGGVRYEPWCTPPRGVWRRYNSLY
jgi:hypothetical protein